MRDDDQHSNPIFATAILLTMYKHSSLYLFLFALLSGTINGQNPLDRYVQFSKANKLVEIKEATGTIPTAVDIDFHPDTTNRGLELWILNQGTSFSGGHTIIVNLGKTSNKATEVKDGNAWHFMALASSLAFGANGNWATAQDIQDANRSGGTFTGPTLWPSDLNVYGKVGNPPTAQVNGSSIGSTHQSPYGKGIAYESDNVYWVMEGYDGTLKRYDFGKPNDPGAHNVADDKVFVYSDFSFTQDLNVPAHIVIDEDKKWLYGCDTKGKRVFRIDITSGKYSKALTPRNLEPIAAYHEYTGIKEETVLDTALSQPVGIDIKGDRLLISDYGTEKLILFDLDNMKELGKISFPTLNNPGLKGVKIGPDGNIYFVDGTNGMVFRLENDSTPITVSTSTLLQGLELYPNPVQSVLNLEYENGQEAHYQILNTSGRELATGLVQMGSNAIDVSALKAGVYFMAVRSDQYAAKQKFIVVK